MARTSLHRHASHTVSLSHRAQGEVQISTLCLRMPTEPRMDELA